MSEKSWPHSQIKSSALQMSVVNVNRVEDKKIHAIVAESSIELYFVQL